MKKINEFLKIYPELIGSNLGEDIFATLAIMCPGLSSPKTGKLLNRAVSYLDDDEIYCEIGTYCGYTLLSAAYKNSARCLGIDNHMLCGLNTTDEQKSQIIKKLQSNINWFNTRNVGVISQDFQTVQLKEKVGVFYIDAEHTFDAVIKNLEWVDSCLSDEALIFVDDISIIGVGEAVEKWTRDHKAYREIFKMRTFEQRDDQQDRRKWNPVFWNGFSIIKYKREDEETK